MAKAQRNFPGVAPKKGRMSKEEKVAIQMLLEQGVDVKDIAQRTGRSEEAIMILVPEAGQPKAEPEEDPNEINYEPDMAINPSKNNIGSSGVGHRPDMPSNGNVAVMTRAGSAIGDKAIEQEKIRNDRTELFSRCVRPIKGYSDEKVKEIEKVLNEEFVKQNANLAKNIKPSNG